MTYQTISEVMDADSGIFAHLQNFDVPWKSQNISGVLDIDYMYNHSGQKIISPLVRNYVSDNAITSDNMDKLAQIIFAICNDNWTKEYNALTVDYSPIENVEEHRTETTDESGNKSGTSSMSDSGTDDHAYGGSDTKTNTGTDTSAQTGTDTTKNTGTIAQSGADTTTNTGTTTNKNVNKDGTSETVNGIAGFNSDEYSKDNKSTTTVNQTITDTRTDDLTETLEHGLTNTNNLTETVEHGLTDTRTLDTAETTTYNNSDNETINVTHSGTTGETTTGKTQLEVYRHGNIGVTTNQQMINEELDLRKTFFYEIVMRDLDKYLTIPIY